MNQRLSPPPTGRDRPIVVALSELDRLEELARAAHRERAEGWTIGPAISMLQDATPSGVILALVSAARVAARLLQEQGSERETLFSGPLFSKASCADCGHVMTHHGHNDGRTGHWIDDGRCFVQVVGPAQNKSRRSAGCKCEGWRE